MLAAERGVPSEAQLLESLRDLSSFTHCLGEREHEALDPCDRKGLPWVCGTLTIHAVGENRDASSVS
jgi:hypothetical protein